MRKIAGTLLICFFPLLLGTTYVVREDGTEVGKWTEDDGRDEVEYLNKFPSERPSSNVISLEEQGFKVTAEEKERARKLWAQDQKLRKEIQARINQAQQPLNVEDDMPNYQDFASTHPFPYVAPPEKQARLKQNYPRLLMGLTKPEVIEILGEPDYSQILTFENKPSETTGSTWKYFFEKSEPGIAPLDKDQSIQVFFDTAGKILWVASSVQGLNRIGKERWDEKI